ncbi:WD40/YVTN/BNR-like repeat-containing protein [Draconibacterium sp.]|uniref:WD40/YVTN/BNR-like repeat-containing protein n=1 Tax=Draconibacterium sp. TaxID=1965318 RepID=UPI003561FCA6
MKFLLTSAFILLLFSCTLTPKKPAAVVFSELNTNTEASLRGLHVVDENTVWASGSGGTVLVSTDSGNSWEDVSVPGAEQNDFRSIHAWDENMATVFGVAGPDFGYKTIDGGATWNVVFSDTTSGLFFNSVKFADAQNGLAVSDPVDGKFFVLRTEDAGNTWEQVTDLPEVVAGEANFAASNTCIEYLPTGKAWIASGGKAARVFYSDDFGKSWNVSKTPMVRGLASSGIFSVAFTNDKEGIIVGGIYDQPELNTNIASYTFDGGVTWQPAVKMPKEYRSCVQEVKTENDSFVFAIGKTGCDISTDGGINWNFLSDDGYYTFRAIPGKLAGFAAGSNGSIAKVEFK